MLYVNSRYNKAKEGGRLYLHIPNTDVLISLGEIENIKDGKFYRFQRFSVTTAIHGPTKAGKGNKYVFRKRPSGVPCGNEEQEGCAIGSDETLEGGVVDHASSLAKNIGRTGKGK